MKVMHVDIETVHDDKISGECYPEPPYGNLKDEKKRQALAENWALDCNGRRKKMACEPRMNCIIEIQACDQNEEWLMGVEKEEANLLIQFWHNIQYYDIIAGFGIMGFDIPTIIQRSIHHGIEPTKDLTNQSIYRREPIYDTQVVLSPTNKPEKGYDLNWYCRHYGLREKTGKASDVYELWKEGKAKEISDYCRGDVLAGKELFDKIYPYYPIPRNYDKEIRNETS